jgi:hypothetical protein
MRFDRVTSTLAHHHPPAFIPSAHLFIGDVALRLNWLNASISSVSIERSNDFIDQRLHMEVIGWRNRPHAGKHHACRDGRAAAVTSRARRPTIR